MATSESGTGRFVWYEYLASDVGSAIGFYSAVLGWQTQRFEPLGGYTMWVGSQGPLGGVVPLPEKPGSGRGRPSWLAYVTVEDVDAAAALARRLGGEISRAPTDIPTVGRFAVIADPQGASLAVYTPQQRTKPHDASKDGEFCWNELVTGDGAAAARFYSELLGWSILEELDMGPMGKYRVFGVGDERRGGITAAPAGSAARPSWLPYASLGDVDAGIERALRGGGKVVGGPTPIPGGGRIAQLTDPQGAAFALHQAPPAG